MEQQIARLAPGQQLPPVRTLMKEMEIGRIRMDSLLDEFESKGYIERRASKGIFRSQSVPKSLLVPYIDIISCGLPVDYDGGKSFFSELIAIFTSEAARQTRGVRFHKVRMGEPIADYESIIRMADIKACVLIGMHSPDITELFDKMNISWVSLFPNNNYNLQKSILPSSEVVKLQLEHLFSLGHTNIAYLHSVNERAPSQALVARREDYYRIMAENGCRVNPDWVRFTSFEDEYIDEVCSRIFSTSPMPTAIIVPDPVLSGLYRFLEKKGLRAGRDVSVVATDDLSIARSLYPTVTSVHVSLKLVVSKTLETINAVVNSEEVPDIYRLPVELIVRESTVSIK